MCGIIGFNWNDKKLLKSCLQKIKHRGPDATSTFLDRSVSLGHNRLSILDLSKSGIQPMSNEDKTLWIIFNGEIYNYKEIKNNLKQKHKFKSNTDTEIILHLYEEKGLDFVNQLQGMFALCIYDVKNKKLILARDRVGIKPLYYFSYDSKFIFASEIKSLLLYKGIKKEVNLSALDTYLTFRANTTDESFIKGIKKLPPGSLLIYDLTSKSYSLKKYWDISFSSKISSENYLSKKIQDLLNDSVKGRLMSDVPYGAYLSGGVDSGIIVSLMKKFSPQKVKTFSVGFKEQKYSETNEARFLAKKLDTDHHELLIDESSIKKLPDIVYHSDEPIADPTLIPIYFLSKYAKKYCTVILTGEGSDEIFGGYAHYKFLNFHSKILSKTPLFIRKFALNLFRLIPNSILNKRFKYSSSLGKKGKERLERFILSNNPFEQYSAQISIFDEKEKKELLIPQVHEEKKILNKEDIINSTEELDFKNPMVEDLLMKIDKMTMASAIEGRVPFLDYRLVELAAKIDQKLKIKNFVKDKYILRETFKGLIPKQTKDRKKQYFFVPIEKWIAKDLMPLRHTLLSEEYLKKQGIFNYKYIKEINSNFKKSPLYYSRQLWTLLIFQIWYKIYIENERVEI
ncbi:MAG: asparagine synthase (glutamine-hydrolyzing) [Nanoarchaeota archaeon]